MLDLTGNPTDGFTPSGVEPFLAQGGGEHSAPIHQSGDGRRNLPYSKTNGPPGTLTEVDDETRRSVAAVVAKRKAAGRYLPLTGETKTCDVCNGMGYTDSGSCQPCEGRGIVPG